MEAITNKYKFPVELAPIETNGILIPKKSAVIRSDTKEPIGVVSDKYALVKHSDVVDSFREALSNTKYEENISVMKNGAHLFATYKLPNVQVEVRKGDFLSLQFVAKNSYDGSKSFSLMLGAMRLVCTNGMMIGHNIFSYTQRHLGKGIMIETKFIKETVADLTEKFREAVPSMKGMSETKMPKTLEEYFNAETLDLPKYLVEEASNEYTRAQDNTLWGYYNSLTYAISHNLKKENPQVRINYTQRAWDAATELIK